MVDQKIGQPVSKSTKKTSGTSNNDLSPTAAGLESIKAHLGEIAALPALVRAPQRKTDIGSKVFGNELHI
jgi:hypothetical protein